MHSVLIKGMYFFNFQRSFTFHVYNIIAANVEYNNITLSLKILTHFSKAEPILVTGNNAYIMYMYVDLDDSMPRTNGQNGAAIGLGVVLLIAVLLAAVPVIILLYLLWR